MPISQESRNVLEEMRRSGVDPTILAGLERELDSKPEVEKVVKNGILAQSSFNDYRTRKDQEVAQLRSDLQNLASLQASSGNLSGDLKTQVEAQIAAKKEELANKGYDVEQITEFVNDLLANPANITKLDNPPEKKDPVMPNNNDDPNRKYVDTKTFTDTMLTGMQNLAAGGINMSVEIARSLHEAQQLGVDLNDDKLNTFGSAMIKGLEEGKTPKQIRDEHFGLQAVRDENQKKQRDAELLAAKEEGRREALKETGNGSRMRFRDPQRNPNPILDRQAKNNADEKLDSRIKKVEDLPKNEKGDPEYFRMRRFDPVTRRHEHTENAVSRFAEVSKEYDDDGLYIGHRQQQSA